MVVVIPLNTDPDGLCANPAVCPAPKTSTKKQKKNWYKTGKKQTQSKAARAHYKPYYTPRPRRPTKDLARHKHATAKRAARRKAQQAAAKRRAQQAAAERLKQRAMAQQQRRVRALLKGKVASNLSGMPGAAGSALKNVGKRAYHVGRFVKNLPFTALGFGYAKARGGSCALDRGLIVTCKGVRGAGPRSGVTIGNTYMTRKPGIRTEVRRHETKHADQWAIFGPALPPLYGLAELAGRGPCGNVFERWAGLRDGHYRC